MIRVLTGLALAGFVSMGTARADVVLSNSLQNINGPYGAGIAVTTTDASGRNTTVTGPGGSGNRASGTASYNTWFQSNVGGGGSVGITNTYAFDGNGSASFGTVSPDSKADLQYYLSTPSLLSSLSAISFDFYRNSASTTQPQLAPVLRLDIAKTTGMNTTTAGSLVFENVYQQQANAPTDTWTALSGSLSQGIFWATNAALGPTFADANGGQKTLQQWINDNAGSTLSVYGLSIGVGSGWSNTFSGAVDDVNVAFGSTRYFSNFEVSPAAAAVPEPASLLLTAAGLGALTLVRRRKAR